MPTFCDITADDLQPHIHEHGIVPRRLETLAALEHASRGLERLHRRELVLKRMRPHIRSNGFGVDPLDAPEGVWAWRGRLTIEKAAPVRTSLAMALLISAERSSRVLPGPARNALDEHLSEIDYAMLFTTKEGSFHNARGTFRREDLPSLRVVRAIVGRWRGQAHVAMERFADA